MISLVVDFLINHADVIILVVGLSVGVLKFCFEYLSIKSNNKLREEYRMSFSQIVSNLSSEVRATQLSSAILLRRFFAG